MKSLEEQIAEANRQYLEAKTALQKTPFYQIQQRWNRAYRKVEHIEDKIAALKRQLAKAEAEEQPLWAELKVAEKDAANCALVDAANACWKRLQSLFHQRDNPETAHVG